MTPTTIHRSIVTLKFPRNILVFVGLAKTILQALTGNSAFPQPDPTLAALQKAIADVESAEALVHTGAKGAVAARNQKRAVLVALLQQLKAYVQKTVDADQEHAPALIQSAGMGMKKVVVRAARVFAVKSGPVSGSVSLVTARAAKRASYEWAFSSDGGKTWQEARATLRSRTSITGLQPGTAYLFRVRPVTKKGDGDWSQPLSFVVQ